MEKKYRIGDETYVQKPVVLGQLKMLLPALDGIPFTGAHPFGVLQSVGERLPLALAIVLVEDGSGVREAMERVEERADRLEWDASPEVCLEVVEDFFECNPVSSVSKRLGEMLEKLAVRAERNPETSKPLCTSSAGETCPKETAYSGGPRPELPSSGSDSTPGRDESQSNGS